MTETTRRVVLAGAAGVTAAALLAACGQGDEPAALAPPAPAPPKPTPHGTLLGKTTEIPVAGGKIFPDQAVVVTQPTPGQFKAFSATCTHKGCLLSGVADGTINCRCHGARFNVNDGSVQSGPATDPLPAKTITVAGDTISFG